MRMTLEEEINHCLEVAEANEKMIEYDLAYTDEQKEECRECAEEHRQLVKWLKELKAYKKAYIEIDIKIERDYTDCSEYDWTVSEGYCGAKNIIDRCIVEVNADEISD